MINNLACHGVLIWGYFISSADVLQHWQGTGRYVTTTEVHLFGIDRHNIIAVTNNLVQLANGQRKGASLEFIHKKS